MMTSQNLRSALDQRLVLALSDREWKWLIKKRYVDEIKNGVGTVQGVTQDIRELRQAFGNHRGPGRTDEPQRAQLAAFTDDPRAKALSEVVAQIAQGEAGVDGFRSEVLGERVLTAAKAARWLARESRMSTRGSIRFLAEGTAALSRLERLAQDLAAIYAWAEPDAERFILTGKVPPVFPVAVSTASRRIPALSRIVLTIDPMVPPNHVARIYRGVRRIFHPHRTRRISAKHAKLAAFAVNRPTKERWAATMHHWNAVCQEHERYDHISNFVRDSKVALTRLLGGRYSSPARTRANRSHS